MEDSRRGCGYVQNDGVYSFTTDQHGFRVYSPPIELTGVEKEQRAAMKIQPRAIQSAVKNEKNVSLENITPKVAPKPTLMPKNNIVRKTSIQTGLPKKTLEGHAHAVHYVPSRNTIQLGHIHTTEQPIKLKLHENYLANIEAQNLLQKNLNRETTLIQITRSNKNIVEGAEYKPELSPSTSLLSDWKNGYITWEQFTQRFKTEIEDNPQSQQALNEIYELSKNQSVTLLCYENISKPGAHCHRQLIMDMLREKTEKENNPLLYEKDPDAYTSQLEQDLSDVSFFQTVNEIVGKDAAKWVMKKTWNNKNTPPAEANNISISRNTEQGMLRGLREKIWAHTNQNYSIGGLNHDDFVEAMLRGYIKPQKPGIWANTIEKKDYPLPDYYKQVGDIKKLVREHTTPEGKINYYDMPRHQRLLAARFSLIEHKKDGWVDNSIKKTSMRYPKQQYKEFSEEISSRIDEETRKKLDQTTQILKIKQDTKTILETPRQALYKIRQIENCTKAIKIVKKEIINQENRTRYIHE
ncbi:MAG: hypothetical protein COS08_01985, partial [Euryarchaeota archaeon CG01_land_8_20_14_3_00_38_12]